MSAALVPLRAETIAARLRDLGIVTPQQLDQARQELATTQERVGVILSRQGVLRDPDAAKRLAAQLGAMPQQVEVPRELPAAAARIPAAVWSTHRLAPVRERNGTVLVATDDPLAVFALEPLGRRYGCALEAVLVGEAQLSAIRARLGELAAASAAPAPQRALPSAPPLPTAAPATVQPSAPPPSPAPPVGSPWSPAATSTVPSGTPAGRHAERVPSDVEGRVEGSSVDDEPIIRLVDSMLREAVRMRASDIHLEGGAQQVRVRCRIDGVLRDVNTPPKALQGPIVSRIKIMAGMNIAEKRLPQDGRLQVSVDNHPLDVRISTLPATHGESVVMRLLDRSQPIRGLPEMGLLPEDQRIWEELIHRPHGMVLVTGPTGSGKTTTLYGALAMLNQPDRKLITVEDPVEYQLPGVNQVSVKSGIGLTFAAGLRSMLRQAPDVIMVGEIRDQETAQVAVQAALTGHLVLSTLHTNDAPSAITRLIDMGIAPFLVASTVQGVLAQRLVRRVCASCRMTDHATEEERAFLGATEALQLIHGVGCEACHGSGFLGRVGIFELLAVTHEVRRLIVAKAIASAIRQAAVRAGMRGLREDGCAKIREGLTTMAEVLRVVSAAEE